MQDFIGQQWVECVSRRVLIGATVGGSRGWLPLLKRGAGGVVCGGIQCGVAKGDIRDDGGGDGGARSGRCAAAGCDQD